MTAWSFCFKSVCWLRQRGLKCVPPYDCARPPGKRSDCHELPAEQRPAQGPCHSEVMSSPRSLIVCRNNWLVLNVANCSKVLTTESFEATWPVAVEGYGKSAGRTPSVASRLVHADTCVSPHQQGPCRGYCVLRCTCILRIPSFLKHASLVWTLENTR